MIAAREQETEAPAETNEPRAASRANLARLVVFGLLIFLYLLRLGAGSLWDNSEPTYGEIVKELFRTGDWITLHYNFNPWFIHPPLWFWTAGASVAVFGLSEFALRLPGAICGLATSVVVYLAGRRLYGENAGLIAALALGTSLEFMVLSRLAILDTMLLLFTTIASLWIYFAIHDNDRRAFWIAVIAAALGTLTKGPVAVVLPVLSLIGYALWTRRRIVSRELPWLAGVAVYVLIAGSWFALETVTVGAKFIGEYFGLNNVGRFLSPFENQPGPFWYYLPLMLIGFFPYVAFLPKAIKAAWQSRGDAERYLIISALVPFVFYSLAQTKLPNYIAVIFPACALLIGRLFGEAIARNSLRTLRGALIMLPVSLVILTISLVLFGELINPGPFHALAPDLALLGWIVIPTAIATLVLSLVLNRVWVAPVGLTLMMAGFAIALVCVILPQAEAFKPIKSFSRTVMAEWRPHDKIGVLGMNGGISLLYYTEGHGITFVGNSNNGDATPAEFFRQPARVLCLTRPKDIPDLRRQGIAVWVVARGPNMVLITNQPPAQR